MRKTTVYLTDEEADGLRMLSAATGRSQSELIREGIRRLTSRRVRRHFHSMGRGAGPGGETPEGWDAGDLYRKSFEEAPS